jgi:hypothetical protein
MCDLLLLGMLLIQYFADQKANVIRPSYALCRSYHSDEQCLSRSLPQRLFLGSAKLLTSLFRPSSILLPAQALWQSSGTTEIYLIWTDSCLPRKSSLLHILVQPNESLNSRMIHIFCFYSTDEVRIVEKAEEFIV